MNMPPMVGYGYFLESPNLKESTVEHCLIIMGESFHSFGATTEKDLSPLVTVLVFGIDSRFKLA